MLHLQQVNAIADEVAARALTRGAVRRVESTPTADQDGDDALSVLIVLTNPAADAITGDQALEALFGIREALLDAGDTRFPFVAYATEDELRAGGDPQS